MPRWIKITLRLFGLILGLIFFAYMALAIYVSTHKEKILTALTKELSKNLDGTLAIGGMDATFLRGFPGVSLSLENVVLKDKQWNRHRHTLLEAKQFEVALNTISLLRGAMEIKKVGIEQATIYLYTDSNGYTNTSVFKKKGKETGGTESDSSTELRRFALHGVNFILDNQKGKKLFHFEIDQLSGKIDYPSEGWHASFKLDALAKSMAFNTGKGSFIENQQLQGPFSLQFHDKTGVIEVAENTLNIGPEKFKVRAKFNTAADPTTFSISISSDKLVWKNAYALLTPNIARRLKMFDFEKTIPVTCKIVGNMGPGAEPLLHVSTVVRDNVLIMPGGRVEKVNFDGYYTNNDFKGRGYNNANSTVKLIHFKGLFDEIPFYIDTAAVNNFDRPVATGVFNADFEVEKLNRVLGADLLNFRQGRAKVKLAYKADMVDLQLTKPYVQGTIEVKNAGFSYVPRSLSFKNTSILLQFTEKDLLIKNLKLQSGKSVVLMDGNIRNFLNLYYTAPEKIVLNWNIRSPQLHLGEFISFLGSRKTVARKKKAGSNLSDDLETAFDKSRVNMQLSVDKVYYDKFLATNAHAELLLTQEGIALNNVRINHAGGKLNLQGTLKQKGDRNLFAVKTTISNVNIQHFFYAFDNFGLTALTSKNLKGYLFSKTEIAGAISESGKIIKNSIRGHVIFDLKEGQLLNFEPITNVGKFAFPLRDLNNISFRNLNGKFDLNGERITINPMKISSSVLNMDVAGIYSLSTGTNIALDIPLRNPKKDDEIEDVAELRKKRMRGIVLKILAVDGEDGKIKLKWNKGR